MAVHPATMTEDECFNMLVGILDVESYTVVRSGYDWSSVWSLRNALSAAFRLSFEGKSPTITVSISNNENFAISHSLMLKLWQHLALHNGANASL